MGLRTELSGGFNCIGLRGNEFCRPKTDWWTHTQVFLCLQWDLHDKHQMSPTALYSAS